MEKLITWFELPAADLDRSRNFYQSLFQVEMTPFENDMFVFPYDRPSATGGAIVKKGEPSAKGTIVYLGANGKLDDMLGRVEKLGGKILLPKTLVNDQIGYIAEIKDTEGNRVGLHSVK